MIVLPCRVARLFLALLKRTSVARPRDAPPFVSLRQGPDGLSLTAWRGDIGLRWRRPGKSEPAAAASTADHLAAFTGTADVTVTPLSRNQAEARWPDRDGEQSRPIPTVEADRVPPFPDPTGRTAALPPALLIAFGEAVRTAARDSGRFALTRVQIRGQAGQLVATDGKPLLVQGGFHFPWADDILVPAAPAVAAREIAGDDVAIGRSASHVLVTAGPWAFALGIDRAGRFPAAEAVIPGGEAAAWAAFEKADVPELAAAVATLPGADAPDAPVTLDVGAAVTLRATDGEAVSQIGAARAFATGRAAVAFNRRYLIRALGLGLTTVEVFGDGQPVVARDADRTYLWAALAPDAVVPPRATTITATNPNPEETPMPTPPPNGHHPPGPTPHPPDGTPPDVLGEAEAVRDLLHTAAARAARLVAALKHQKKQTRALRQAVESLRGLPHFDT